ncbi:MAG: hypothetical protein ACTHU0_35015 [Kofleriaceae bacterium]
MRSRGIAVAVTLVLLGATLEPLIRDPANDGFPLSTYPMFAWERPTTLTMSYGLGVTASGTTRYLTPELIGSGEVLQARAIIERAIGRRSELQALCAQVAARVAAHPRYADVVTIRFVTGTHDAVELLVRGQLGKETRRGECPVPRGAP